MAMLNSNYQIKLQGDPHQDISWLSDLLDWARTSLQTPLLDVAVVSNTPWSKVVRCRTRDGVYFLKQPVEDFYMEVDVIKACADLGFKDCLPSIVEVNATLHCFLMASCGDTTLRDLLDRQLRIDLFDQSLHVYRDLQKASAPCVEHFIRVKVPDWRLHKWPALYRQIVEDGSLLSAHEINAPQITALRSLVPMMADLAAELQSYRLGEGLNHTDFHDNNVIWHQKLDRLTLIDWGESAINHPFFSLMSTFKRFVHRHQIGSGSIEYQRLYGACFYGWLDDEVQLGKALTLTRRLLPMYTVLAHQRLLDATAHAEMVKIERMRSRVKDALIELLALNPG